MSATPKTRTVAYLRVSTVKQADEGVSLEAQRAKVTAYALAMDLDLVAIIEDAGASAKTLDRPGLTQALGMLRKDRADALLVMKLDRLTRSVRDLGTLVETHFAPGRAALLSMGESVDTRTAGGRLVLNVLASVSQWEREAIGERTSVALRHMQASGRYIGGAAPFGYALEGETLAPVEAEQATLARARELRAEGLSLRAVADRLEEEGRCARNGRPFTAEQVRRLLATADRTAVPAAVAA